MSEQERRSTTAWQWSAECGRGVRRNGQAGRGNRGCREAVFLRRRRVKTPDSLRPQVAILALEPIKMQYCVACQILHGTMHVAGRSDEIHRRVLFWKRRCEFRSMAVMTCRLLRKTESACLHTKGHEDVLSYQSLPALACSALCHVSRERVPGVGVFKTFAGASDRFCARVGGCWGRRFWPRGSSIECTCS